LPGFPLDLLEHGDTEPSAFGHRPMELVGKLAVLVAPSQ
jgi:hypothetical protein